MKRKGRIFTAATIRQSAEIKEGKTNRNKISPAITPRIARQRDLGRLRNKALRQRERDARKTKPKGNRLRCYPVWLLDSEVIKLLHDVEPERHDDQPIIPRELREVFDREWSEVTGRVIAQAARSAIKNKS